MAKTIFNYENKQIQISGLETDHIFKVINETKSFYENEMLEKIREIGASNLILDIGANIGNHTIFFALFTDAKKIISVEPYQLARKYLEENLLLNNLVYRVDIISKAIDQSSGEVEIEPADQDNIGKTKTVKGYGIVSTTIDELVGDNKVDIIKIDIEGNELNALNGAKLTLKNSRPDLFVEAPTQKQYQELCSFLEDFGYSTLGKYNWTDTYHFSSDKQD